MSKKNNGNLKAKDVMNYSYAPYNFIPLSKRIIKRYNSIEELPPHNEFLNGALSGDISYTIENVTNIIVSDGKGKFFKNTDGRYVIPGSSIRGKLRGNVEILGFSSIIDDIEDNRFLYRRFATGSKLNKEYKDRLGMKVETINGKRFSILENVEAGYIKNCGGDKYVIVKSKVIKNKTYFRITEKELKEKYKGIKGINFMRNENYNPYTKQISFKVNTENKSISDINEKGKLTENGWLLNSGNIKGKKSHYIVNEIGNEEINISNEDIRLYMEYYIRDKKSKINHNGYYSLPEKKGQTKPVFYTEYKDRVYFGFTPYLRLFYDNSIYSGVPKEHKEDVIDYNKSMFGFTSKDKSYKTRISVEDAVIEGNPNIITQKMSLQKPNPTCIHLYLQNRGDTSAVASYNGDFEIRGVKYYWLKESISPEIGKENVNSTEESIEKGNKFNGKISFTNLHEDELGLLLWALFIHEDANQNIGKGKPYGFGNIKIKNISVNINNIENRYKDIFNNSREKVPFIEYINKYKSYAKLHLKGLKDLEDDLSIKTFVEVHKNKTREQEVEYMKIEKEWLNNKINQFEAYIPLTSPFKIMGVKQEIKSNGKYKSKPVLTSKSASKDYSKKGGKERARKVVYEEKFENNPLAEMLKGFKY